MQNLVRSTGRTVWYLNDPIEDDPKHDWEDYRVNWEPTLVASLFQPEVWQFEVAPWPERVFGGRYPAGNPNPQPIPPAYATELQTVMNALKDLKQEKVQWDCGTTGLGIVVSDSLMFQRGEPQPSDSHMSHLYGLALPLLKRGMPLTPVQLENFTVPKYLAGFRVLLLTYQGMKPLSPEVHTPLVDWVKKGGMLVVCDDDQDPYNGVRDWWNSDGKNYATPREHLFQELGLGTKGNSTQVGTVMSVGKGGVIWLRQNPASLATSPEGDRQVVQAVERVGRRAGLKWRETNYLLLRRGPYVIASGLDESIDASPKRLEGRFVNLFDPELRVRTAVEIAPASRALLLDLDALKLKQPQVLASACKALPVKSDSLAWVIEGVANTPGLLLVHMPRRPSSVQLDGVFITTWEYASEQKLLWVRFQNESRPRQLQVTLK